MEGKIILFKCQIYKRIKLGIDFKKTYLQAFFKQKGTLEAFQMI